MGITHSPPHCWGLRKLNTQNHASVMGDMHPTITALKKRIRGEKGDTGITISKLTGRAALFRGGRGEKNVSSVLLLSDTVHLSGEGWLGVRGSGRERWQREGARGVITAMLRPEGGEICTRRD